MLLNDLRCILNLWSGGLFCEDGYSWNLRKVGHCPSVYAVKSKNVVVFLCGCYENRFKGHKERDCVEQTWLCCGATTVPVDVARVASAAEGIQTGQISAGTPS